ncbi:MAG: hypothetical protein KDJ37_00860 [Hyphomicrobiaceae bacterium]|nr:hypothetical protein [Hyphomicrobiaceae bacterium]
MPYKIKVIFSLVVLAVAYGSYLFLGWLGQDVTPYVALFLGIFSVGSFWIFPEVSHKKDRKS